MKTRMYKAKRTDWKNLPKSLWWVVGVPVNINDEDMMLIIPCNPVNQTTLEKSSMVLIETNFVKIDANTLCQDTGLLDKNKNIIWEKDILLEDDEDMRSVVEWDESNARFVIEEYGQKGCIMEYGWDEDAGEFGVVDTMGFDDFVDSVSNIFEVIGNIFDSPELLK